MVGVRRKTGPRWGAGCNTWGGLQWLQSRFKHVLCRILALAPREKDALCLTFLHPFRFPGRSNGQGVPYSEVIRCRQGDTESRILGNHW